MHFASWNMDALPPQKEECRRSRFWKKWSEKKGGFSSVLSFMRESNCNCKHWQTITVTHLDANIVCWVLGVVQSWKLLCVNWQSQHHSRCHSDEVCADCLGHKGAWAGGPEVQLYHLQTVYKLWFSTNAAGTCKNIIKIVYKALFSQKATGTCENVLTVLHLHMLQSLPQTGVKIRTSNNP